MIIPETNKNANSTVGQTVSQTVALELWFRDFSVIPMVAGEKRPAIPYERLGLGKRVQMSSEIRERKWDGANIAVINGVNHVRSVDIDACDKPEVLEAVLTALGLPMDYGYIAVTPGKTGGYHIHFICRETLETDKSVLVMYPSQSDAGFKQIEFRWHNCLTMLPPSIHPNGNRYEWLVDPTGPLAIVDASAVKTVCSALKLTPKQPSAHMIDPMLVEFDDRYDGKIPTTNNGHTAQANVNNEPQATSGCEQANEPIKFDQWTDPVLIQECEKIRTANEGERNSQLNKSAFRLGQIVGSGLLRDEVAIRELTRVALQAGLSEDETARTIVSGMSAGVRNPRVPRLIYRENESERRLPPMRSCSNETICSYAPTDLGNAECVKFLYGEQLAHNDALGWMIWNGKCFEPAPYRVPLMIAQAFRLRAKAANEQHNEEIAAKSVTMARAIGACQSLLASLCYVDVSEFDVDGDLFNFQNGVVDLRTSRLYPHDPAFHFTWCANVEYKPDALNMDNPLWQEFLRSAIPMSEVREYLQLALGYAMTGHTSEECLFYMFGPTRSGKGTISETLLALVPRPIFMETDFVSFTSKRENDTQCFDLAPLRPARIVFASESNKYQSLNPAKVKALTGGNEIHCAFKHKDTFSYKPKYTIILSSNHDVNADVDDDAIWNRVKAIELPNSHLGEEDRSLKRRLLEKEQLEYIAAWLVTGARKWYERGSRGLETPQAVKQATLEQREKQDTLRAWLDECCELDTDACTHGTIVRQSYENWCKENGVTPKQRNAFYDGLRKRNLDPRKLVRMNDGKVARCVQGLRVM